MCKVVYKPEGTLINTPENREYLQNPQSLERAKLTGKILEGRAIICDGGHNLIVDLGCMKGIIPREEAALGIADGSVRDIAIITRVNKPVCFKVINVIKQPDDSYIAMLSRRAAQEECESSLFEELKAGDIIDGRVTHLEPFGCFVDIGCGVISLITIDNISVSRISHPRDRFFTGQPVKAIIKEIDAELKRITLSHKELLGTWEENAGHFSPGQTVAGVIRSIEDYGIFVELTPNLAGLAEFREGVKEGQSAAVFIKNIIPEKMKVKLSIIDSFDNEFSAPKCNYYISQGHVSKWIYSPACCEKLIETVFD